MEKKLKYKGVTLYTNDFGSIVNGESLYVVICGNKKFPFKSIKEFKDAVNGKTIYPKNVIYEVAYIENGDWGTIPLDEFKNFALNYE